MKKKIKADLTSLAHDILKLRDSDELALMQARARALYEKITILRFAEERLDSASPTIGRAQVEIALENANETAEEAFENPDLSQLFVPSDVDARDEIELPGSSTIKKMVPEMGEELEKAKDVIAQPKTVKNDMFDIGADYDNLPQFERVDDTKKTTSKTEPKVKATAQAEEVIEDLTPSKINDQNEGKVSLNDRLKGSLKIGMNDRLGFIKHLFGGNDGDYNRVISQLNTFESLKDAQAFIQNNVKPDYNWSDKDDYEARLMSIVASRFS